MIEESPPRTDRDFDAMSWHDNHVHGLRIVEGKYGAGELVLDLDYIEAWLKGEDGRIRFRIVPSLLTFRDVTALRITLDYASVGASLQPFSIHLIERRIERRERYDAQLWRIELNWPKGELAFEASGFEQRAASAARESDEQWLKR